MFVKCAYLQSTWWWRGWWRSLWRTMDCCEPYWHNHVR
jgi:hypothetical protein